MLFKFTVSFMHFRKPYYFICVILTYVKKLYIHIGDWQLFTKGIPNIHNKSQTEVVHMVLCVNHI